VIRVRSTDDRARPVRLVRFAPIDRPASVSPARRSLFFLRLFLLQSARLASSRPGRWIFALTLVILTVLALTAVHGPQVIAITMFSPVSSSIIVLVSLTAVAVVSSYRNRAHDVTSRMIRAQRCPACAYPLTDIDPEADGCTPCPECGAAWKLNDPSYADSGGAVIVVAAEPTSPAPSSPATHNPPAGNHHINQV
jgi:ribosomal protein L37AE/L43A